MPKKKRTKKKSGRRRARAAGKVIAGEAGGDVEPTAVDVGPDAVDDDGDEEPTTVDAEAADAKRQRHRALLAGMRMRRTRGGRKPEALMAHVFDNMRLGVSMTDTMRSLGMNGTKMAQGMRAAKQSGSMRKKVHKMLGSAPAPDGGKKAEEDADDDEEEDDEDDEDEDNGGEEGEGDGGLLLATGDDIVSHAHAPTFL